MDKRAGGLQATSATLKALSHPVRLKLIDALLGSPMTATELASTIDESPTTCSFHLRQLQKYGLVTIHQIGPGRRRSWKLLYDNITIAPNSADDEYREASTAAFQAMLEAHFERLAQAVNKYHEESPQWQRAIIGSTSTFYLTDEELRDVSSQIELLIKKYANSWGNRATDARQRPIGARKIELSIFGVPAYLDRP